MAREWNSREKISGGAKANHQSGRLTRNARRGQCTQAGPGFHPKFLGQYYVILLNDRYTVQREGEHEEPQTTFTAADYIKLWVIDEDSAISETNDGEHTKVRCLYQNGRV